MGIWIPANEAASPTTPASGYLAVYPLSSDKRLRHKDDAGLVSLLVTADGADTLTSKTLTSPIINGATSSGSTAINLSGNSGAFSTPTGTNTMGGPAVLIAGTTALTPLNFPAGTLRTTPAAGDNEFDGVQFYSTIDTTSSRGAIPVEQYFHLTSDGSTITTIANFFGATSNIKLVASAYYEIEIFLWYVMTGTGNAVTFTLTNNSAPTSQNIHFELSPAAGIVSTAAATALLGAFLNDATAARTIVTPSLTTSSSQYARIRIFLKNGTGTTLQIQATSTNAITPKIGSWWRCIRRSPNNIGTFAA